MGNFTLPLARHCAAIVGIEGSTALVRRAQQNAQLNGIDNAQFVAADLSATPEALASLQHTYDLVLLDPPRSGAAELCRFAPRFAARRIVYVSCHPATLARDAAILTAAGYTLEAAGVMDMFPHTAHVESIAVFGRQS